MTYRKFELLLTGLGFAIVLATIITSLGYEARSSNIIGQALMAPVLFVSLHWGRKTGPLAALAAALIYLAYSTTSAGPSFGFVTQETAIRAISYGAVGILSGELAHRMKYILAGMNDQGQLDVATRVFDRSYLVRLIQNCISYHSRYSRPFSVIMIEIKPLANQVSNQPIAERGMRLAAMILRDNIRIIDELGSWNEHTLVVVAPDTTVREAPSACTRMIRLLEEQLDAYGFAVGEGISVSGHHLSFPSDREKITGMLGLDQPNNTKRQEESLELSAASYS